MTDPSPMARSSPDTASAETSSFAPAPLDPVELAGDPRRLAAVLATVLDQQSRDASANRAQARELIRAVEGLAKSHEYLGTELREERRRARSLLVALVLVPVVVLAAGAAVVWSVRSTDDRLEVLRSDVARDRQALQSDRETERIASGRVAVVRTELEARIAAAAADGASVRVDLDTTRAALAEERRLREERERSVSAKLAESERVSGEVRGLRSEVGALREVAGAEKARADELARLLAAAVTAAPPAFAGPLQPAGASAADARVPRGLPAEPAAGGADRPVSASAPSAAPQPTPRATPPTSATATRDPADLDRIRTRINGLLEGTTGAARYEIESLSGVSALDLLGVRVTGRDESGRTLRTVEAARLEISVAADGAVRLRFVDGFLIVGGRKAPFFDGAYTLSLEGSAKVWRESGLTCLRIQ
ncbi:MAG: hypothetical protein K8T90_16170 [Planctomycetes bacterium]|nr:hypothetical protein [Planctomycetota bacterium]